MERWLDDILLHSASLADRFALIEEVFDLLQHAGYSVHFRKSMFCMAEGEFLGALVCLLYTSPSPRDKRQSRMPSSA